MLSPIQNTPRFAAVKLITSRKEIDDSGFPNNYGGSSRARRYTLEDTILVPRPWHGDPGRVSLQTSVISVDSRRAVTSTDLLSDSGAISLLARNITNILEEMALKHRIPNVERIQVGLTGEIKESLGNLLRILSLPGRMEERFNQIVEKADGAVLDIQGLHPGPGWSPGRIEDLETGRCKPAAPKDSPLAGVWFISPGLTTRLMMDEGKEGPPVMTRVGEPILSSFMRGKK